ncbi:hypothetical protein [Acidovorax sp. BLS4]|uniref:hypothetical protein n=1 Tax=Acidovorax sp. BLS4 TaxID=3273430 RepID=UPI002943A042|nr:hypothetical protein [Paracidovorax avenae]WOI48199.1 hypothetical protein R1Z03_24470 [Paracidovorax avenae]
MKTVHYKGTRPGGWSHYEIARAIGWATGRRPWVLHLSPAMLGRVAKLDGWWRKDKAKLTADRVSYMCHPDWVVSERARPPARLWQPEIETRAGLRATARCACAARSPTPPSPSRRGR